MRGKKNGNVRVSVIVPVYNVAPYLPRCLDSLVAQTLKDIEIICIDDKSTDNSLDILHQYRDKYPQIHVIELKKNSGVATARNAGIDAARGEYLGFVDSDDYVDTDFYEKLYETAKKENADIAKAEATITEYDKKSVLGANQMDNIRKYGKWRFIYHWWSAIYKAKLLSKNNIKFQIDIISGQDTVFLNKCIQHTNDVALCYGTFYNYVRRENSLDSTILSPEKIESKIKAILSVCDVYNKSALPPVDYLFCYYNWWAYLPSLLKRNTLNSCKIKVASSIIDAYTACKDKNALLKKHVEEYAGNEPRIQYIQSHDAEGLISAIQNHKPVRKETRINKIFYLFAIFPFMQIKRNAKYTKLRFCGIDLIKIKYSSSALRICVLYIPIVRIKSK